MNRRLLALVAVASIIPLVSGCLTAAKVEPVRYYLIEPEVAIEPGTAGNATLGIRPLLGARPYKLEIAYALEENRLAYFGRAEWAELPATMVTRAIADAVTKQNIFADVGDAANMARPTFILTGELRRFEADFSKEIPSAVVELTAAIRTPISGHALWQGHKTVVVPLENVPAVPASRNSDAVLSAVADAMSMAVSELAGTISAEVRARIDSLNAGGSIEAAPTVPGIGE